MPTKHIMLKLQDTYNVQNVSSNSLHKETLLISLANVGKSRT